MIDIENLRENPDLYKDSIKKRGGDETLINRFLEVDEKWRESLTEVETLRSEQKKLGVEKKIDEAKKVKDQLSQKQSTLKTLEEERSKIFISIPNLLHKDVPYGKDESENIVLRKWGKPTKFGFKPKDHIELGEALDIIDTKRAVKVSGSRFTYLKGDAVLLQMALIRLVFDILTNKKILKKIAKGHNSKPFIPLVVPDMIKPEVFERMGRLSEGNKDDKFYLEKDNLYLAGSAEHTMASMFMDETIKEKDLPLRFIGYSTSFRREAGTYGKDTKGIFRQHQFDKLEMESFTTKEDSEKEQEFIIAIQEYLMQKLDIPYQVVAICSGDTTAPDARQIDIEAWMPAQDKYRETHTSDLMTDYQSRGLGIKIKRNNGKTEFAHMNDATAFAIGRTLIAILENYQTKEGKIKIPGILSKYI